MGRRSLRVLIPALAIVGAGRGGVDAQTIPCRQQCRLLGQACIVPYKVAFQTQRAACTGDGRRLCIATARIMYAAGRTLCRSVLTSCRQGCRRNGAPSELDCGDGDDDVFVDDCDFDGEIDADGGDGEDELDLSGDNSFDLGEDRRVVDFEDFD